LSQEALDGAENRLSIRMTAVKGSINVGVACGIALHAWWVEAQMSDRPDD
jgi:tRNA G18 (ribose-2'-O)-methylase SpoU